MSFPRLAKVEAQLVMRCCDWRALMALSRTSHAAYSAASEPFAWACVPPVALRSHSMATWFRGQCHTLTFAQRLSRSLLRLAPIELQWIESRTALWEEERTELLDNLAATPRLVGLDASAHRWLGSRELESLLLHPSLTRLESLSFGVSFPLRAAQCLTQLPHLRTLHFTAGSLQDGCAGVIASLPALTELCINQAAVGQLSRAEKRDLLLGCPKLESLILKGGKSGAWLLDLIDLGSPEGPKQQQQAGPSPLPYSSFVRNLRALTLWDTSLSDEPAPGSATVAEQWAAAFAALTSLRSFRLQECTRRAAIVRAILEHPPPCLTALRIDESPMVPPMCFDRSASSSAAATPAAAHRSNIGTTGAVDDSKRIDSSPARVSQFKMERLSAASTASASTSSAASSSAASPSGSRDIYDAPTLPSNPAELNLSMLLACMERVAAAGATSDLAPAADLTAAAASTPAAATASLLPSRSPLLIDLHLPSLAQYQRLQGWPHFIEQQWARARDDAATLVERVHSSARLRSAYRLQCIVDAPPPAEYYHRAAVVPRAPEHAWNRTWF